MAYGILVPRASRALGSKTLGTLVPIGPREYCCLKPTENVCLGPVEHRCPRYYRTLVSRAFGISVRVAHETLVLGPQEHQCFEPT